MRPLCIQRPIAVAAGLVACLLAVSAAGAGRPAGVGLELRRLTDAGLAPGGWQIPRDAIRVFVYEGTPQDVRVTDSQIAADYGRSGVLFDRATGEPARRFTVADGWPTRRPEAFGPYVEPWRRPRMVGPGVVNVYRRPLRPGQRAKLTSEVACTAEYAGRTWRALQPANFLRSVKRPDFPGTGKRAVTWSSILTRLNGSSYLEADPGGGAAPRRFTTADGLTSNIVTHLAVCGDSLWAACVDIYDMETKKWGPGGLCRYDQRANRWQRISQIDGRPVRWVTLLQAIGDELWVGFREGEGVAGEEVTFGMGLYPGMYRPETASIVLACLAGGRWRSFSRDPQPETTVRGGHSAPKATPSMARGGHSAPKATPSTEYPCNLGRVGNKVVLFCRADAHQLSGNWDVPLAGHVSLLDVRTKGWRVFDLQKDLNADQLMEMVAERGDVLVTSNQGLHRFDAGTESWRRLDSKCPLRNPTFHTAAVVGNELWLGYGRQSFGEMGQQGISRFSERTGRWSHMLPEQLGTASPVRRIVTLAGGEVWVLFGQRPYMGAAVQYLFYPREQVARATGLGRFAGGRWEFPVAGPKDQPDRPRLYGFTDDLAAVGDKLVYATASAVYVGPKPWKAIVRGDVVGIAPTADRKAVEIICRMPGTAGEGGGYRRGLYRPGAAEVRLGEFKVEDFTREHEYMMGDSLLSPIRPAGRYWFHLPGFGDDRWVINNPGGGYYGQSALETPSAVWVFLPGGIARLDPRILADLARGHADKQGTERR